MPFTLTIMADRVAQVNQMYRKSTLGLCLSDTIDDLVISNMLPPHAIDRIWVNFDKVRIYYLVSQA